MLALDPDWVITMGDLVYPTGMLWQYLEYYEPTWGRFKDRTLFGLGNHDCYDVPRTSGAKKNGCDDAERYWGPDSSYGDQVLAADNHLCEMVVWHHPRFSSGEHGDQEFVAPWFETLYEHGVDVVLNGHDHDYERFVKLNPAGLPDANGARIFVNGLGGASTEEFMTTRPGSQVRITGNENWSVLRLRLEPAGYIWRLIDADSGGTLDLGGGPNNCHA